MDLPLDWLMEKAMKEHIPVRAMMELTHRCNLKCSHCFIEPTKSEELTLAETKTLLSDLLSLGTLFLTLTGGEVFMRSDFLDICQHARELGFALHIKTNGTLINKDRAKQISQFNPMAVDISIYGAGPEQHDAVTGIKGSFAASIRAIDFLTSFGAPVQINTVLMTETSHNYIGIRDLAKSLGVGFQVDPIVVVKSNGSDETTVYRTDESCLADFMADMTDEYAKSVSPQVVFDEVKGARLCGTGSTGVFISADGTVSPCVLLRLDCGNVKSTSLCDIWHTSGQLEQVRNMRLGDLTACSQCELFGYCRRCTGVAYLEDHDMHGCSMESKRQAMVYKALVTANRLKNGQ